MFALSLTTIQLLLIARWFGNKDVFLQKVDGIIIQTTIDLRIIIIHNFSFNQKGSLDINADNILTEQQMSSFLTKSWFQFWYVEIGELISFVIFKIFTVFRSEFLDIMYSYRIDKSRLRPK